VIIQIPSTGERVDAYIVADEPAAPLAVTFGAGRARYTLAPMLNVGWQILEASPAERAVLTAHGVNTD
jgi:hypothetical protein